MPRQSDPTALLTKLTELAGAAQISADESARKLASVPTPANAPIVIVNNTPTLPVINGKA